jgi:hypothetical protein
VSADRPCPTQLLAALTKTNTLPCPANKQPARPHLDMETNGGPPRGATRQTRTPATDLRIKINFSSKASDYRAREDRG